MSYIGNTPGVSSQRVVLEEVVSGSPKSTFTPISGYTLGYVDVLVNGVEVDTADFTASDGVNVILATAAAVGDTVKIKTWLPRGLSDGYLKSESDARFLNLAGGSLTGGLGVGVALNSWAGGNTALQMAGPSMWGASGVSHWSTNTYFDGTNYKYIASNYVTDYYQLNGAHVWRYAPSGTAGSNVASLIEAMRIDANGNVGIGTNSPNVNTNGTVLHINNSTASRAAIAHFTTAASGSGVADGLIVGKWSDDTNYIFDYDSNPIVFGVNSAEAMRIDTARNIFIGTATGSGKLNIYNGQNSYIEVASNGRTPGTTSMMFGQDINGTGYVWNRENSAVTFGTNNTTRMTLTSQGTLAISTTVADSYCKLSVSGQYNFNTTTPGTQMGLIHLSGQQTQDYSNAITFNGGTTDSQAHAGIYVQGSGTYGSKMRFGTTDSYALGSKIRLTIDHAGSIGAPSGTNIYNASDRRLKQNVQPIADALAKVLQLSSVSYNWIEGFCPDEDGKTLYGWVAQEVQEVDTNLVESFGANDLKIGDEIITSPLRVNEKFIVPLLVTAIQELNAKVDAQAAEIAALKGAQQ